MQIWILHSLLAMLGFSGIYILLKYISNTGLHATVINFWFFLLTAVGFLLLSFSQKLKIDMPLNITWHFLILALVAVFGNYFAIKAYETAPNAGYASAIIAVAAVIMTIASLFLFDANFNMIKLFGVVLTIIGVAIVAIA